MLEIKNLTKYFGGTIAVYNCSFVVPDKQITALIGPNGAGKTTVFDLVSGLLKADSGQVFLSPPYQEREQKGAGLDLTKLPSYKIANLHISRTFQQVRLFKHLTILDHLLITEDNDDTKLWRNVFGIAEARGSSREPKSRKHAERKEYIESFGIDRSLATVVSELSYGQRKLLQLAMALRKHHHLLMLDEPVAGVNAVIQRKIEDLILQLKERDETILIVEHDMDFVRRLADHVIVLDEGRVLLEGPPDRVLKDKKVLEAYLGE